MDTTLGPSSRYGRIAEFTASIDHVELALLIPVSLYEHLAAVMTVGMASFMSGNIPQIDIVNSFLQSLISKPLHGFYGCRW